MPSKNPKESGGQIAEITTAAVVQPSAQSAKISRIAAVIPCFRASQSIAAVVAGIPEEVSLIVCIDDASDDGTLDCLNEIARIEPRLRVVTHDVNKGVGGATISGYRKALDEGAEILAKIDSDGQMDPSLILPLVAPILEGSADYTKGNRFFDIEAVREMPSLRLFGNAGLSFITKLATGYWDLFDPTNGFTAIHSNVVRILPLDKLHERYFFESDVLFRLSTVRARVVEVPMAAVYGEEVSNLSVTRTLLSFPVLHLRSFLKRIIYNYFLRGFSAASLSLLAGLPLTLFGVIFGIDAWVESAKTSVPATAGTVMLSALPLIIGLQLLLSFLQQDVASIPDRPIHTGIERLSALKAGVSSGDETAAAERENT